MLRWLIQLFQAIFRFFSSLFGIAPSPAPAPPPTPPPGNNPPDVSISAPVVGTYTSPVHLEYVLFDVESDPVRIEVAYSTDQGATFTTASEAAGAGSQGLTGLTSSPGGTRHLFVWDAVRDLGTPVAQDLLLRVKTFDAQPGGEDTTVLFDIGAVRPPPPGNNPPDVSISAPVAGTYTSPVRLEYLLFDVESDPVRIEVAYSTDQGATFTTASEAAGAGSQGLTGLTSSPGGTRHLFVWDAVRDLGTPVAQDLLLRVKTFDAQPGGEDTTVLFDIGAVGPPPPGNNPPDVSISAPTPGTYPSPVRLAYTLRDTESDPVRIEVTYSTDQGTSFQPATEAGGVGSQGTNALASSPAGFPHVFMWDAAADLGTPTARDVMLRIASFDAQAGGVDATALFDIGQAPPAPTPSPTEIKLFKPMDEVGPRIPLRMVLSDPDSERVDVLVEYKLGTGGYTPATAAADSDGMTRIPAPFLGGNYRFIWDALTDLGVRRGSAVLRVTVSKGGVVVSQETSATFAVNTTPLPPPPPLGVKRPVVISQMTASAGAGQHGISGHLLPEPMRVLVVDTNGRPLQGARVTFISIPPAGTSTPIADIEREPGYWTTTDGQGHASVRFRIRKGVVPTATPVSATIEARVQGKAGATVIFPFTVHRPTIMTAGAPAQMTYGQEHRLNIGLLGRGTDIFSPEYLPDPAHPRLLEVTAATNADVSQRKILVPDPQGSAAPEIRIVPTDPVLPVEVTFGDPNDTTVVSHTIRATVTAPTTIRRTRATSHAGPNHTPTTLVLRPKGTFTTPAPIPPPPPGTTGTTTTGTSTGTTTTGGTTSSSTAAPRPRLVGYPGLTLAHAFEVELTDGRNFYTEEVTHHFSSCSNAPTLQPLRVQYSTWNGTLATAATPGTAATLDTDINTPVYFTPTGPGPWMIIAETQGRTHDVASQRVLWNDASGNTHCVHDHAFYSGGGGRFTFVVDEATDIRTVSPTGASMTEVKAGDRFRLEVHGLSPTAGGAPQDLTLKTLRNDFSDLPTYTGPGLNRYIVDQGIGLSVRHVSSVEDVLRSPETLAIPADPHTVSSAPRTQTLLPHGWLRASADGIGLYRSIGGREFNRALIGSVASTLETLHDTSPQDGYGGTVLVHNGEFVATAIDITLKSRAGELTFSRTWRCHTEGEGPLGPGWYPEHADFLDLSDPRGFRWYGSNGRLDDFTFGPAMHSEEPPKGYFVKLTKNIHVTADQSPVEIMDPHRNEIHFNLDGSLRFHRDRMGNRTAFRYDEKGRLAGIADAHGRVMTLRYGANDRLSSFEAVDGRKVTYEYYPAGHPYANWLKTVRLPKAETVTTPGAAVQTDYERTATYEYQNRRMHKILDSRGTVRLENTYDTTGRVRQQKVDNDTYDFDYATALETKVTNRERQEMRYIWTEYPLADGAAPVAFVDRMRRRYTLEHNLDGHLVHLQDPAGEEQQFVYDDQSQWRRRRGNLLAIRKKNGSEERTWTFTYNGRYNFVQTRISPRGNVDDATTALYETRYLYDYQVRPGMDPDLQQGNKGNLVRVSAPRAMHLFGSVNTAGNPKEFWIEDNAKDTYRHSGFSQLIWHKDPHGVVTEYKYYPDANPVAGAASSGGGGFLAESSRDTTANAYRDNYYLRGVPLQPRTTKFRYDAKGHLQELEDPGQNVFRVVTSDLGEVLKVSRPSGAAGNSQPTVIETEFDYNPDGLMVETRHLQPGQPAESGGAQRIERLAVDGMGNVTGASASLRQGTLVEERMELNRNGEMKGYFPPDTVTGPYPDAGVRMNLDGQGLPQDIREGTSQTGTGSLHTHGVNWTRRRTLRAFTQAGAGQYTLDHDGFGEPVASVDSMGNVHRVVREGDGTVRAVMVQHGESGPNVTNRSPSPSPAEAPVTAFTEVFVDEMGRRTRHHAGRFRPGAQGAASTSPPVTNEGFPATPGWPPDTGPVLADGPWGAGDGRTTVDRQFDALGYPSRIVEDGLGFTLIRRDAHSAPLQISRWAGTSVSGSSLMTFETLTHDAMGNPIEKQRRVYPTGTGGYKTWPEKQDFDALGRQVRVVDGEGNAVSRELDEAGHVYAVYDAVAPDANETFNGKPINQPGNKTAFVRDGRGNIIKKETTMTVGGVGGAAPDSGNPFNSQAISGFERRYSPQGRLWAHKDRDQNETEWRYDNYGRLESVQYASASSLGGTTASSLEYDPSNGRLQYERMPNGSVKAYFYDNAGKTTEIRTTDASGNTGGYTFRYEGAATIMTDTNSRRVLTMHQDSSGNILEEIQGGVRVTSEFDGVGRRTALYYPATGPQVDFERDTGGRLRRVRSQGRSVVSFDYLGTDAITQRTQGGVGISYRYSDASARLDGISINGLSASVSYDLKRDRMNRLKRSTRLVGSLSDEKHWEYDSAGRVVQERRTGALGAATTDRLFDGDGVLRRETRGTARYDQQREERGRIRSRNNTTFGYDANGNLTDDGNRTFEWDAWDRLVRVKDGIRTLATFEYDPLHRLTRKAMTLSSEEYVWDTWRLIEVRDGGGVVKERYIYSDDLDDVVSIETGGATYFPVYGPEGHVDMLVDASQNIVERYEYDLHGRVIVLDAMGTQIPNAVPKCRFLFQRRWYDADVGLYLFRRRWYHPDVGTFLSPDPLGFETGSNLYGLCHGDPINFSDPFGLDDEEDSFWTWGKIAGIAAAVVIGTVVTVATAGLAGPVVGATAAAIIGGMVGGAVGGAVGAITEGLVDHGEVDWGEVGWSALIGGALGGVFSFAGVGIAAFFTRTATGVALSQGAARLGTQLGGRLATSAAGEFLRNAGTNVVVRGAGRMLAAPVRGAGRALRGIHNRSESLGIRLLPRNQRVPLLGDVYNDMAQKAMVAEASLLDERAVAELANAGRNAMRDNADNFLFQSVITVDDLGKGAMRVNRRIFAPNGTTDEMFSTVIPTSRAPWLLEWSNMARRAWKVPNLGGGHNTWPDLVPWGDVFWGSILAGIPGAPAGAAVEVNAEE